MTPEPFAGSNVLLKAPAGWNEEMNGPCMDQAAFVGNHRVVTVWRPDQEEIALLVGGGVLVLTLVTESAPPTQVRVLHSHVVNNGLASA